MYHILGAIGCNHYFLKGGCFFSGDQQLALWGAPLPQYITLLTSIFSSASDLNKHKRYEIRVSVYNAAGEGPTSVPQEVFVGEAGKSL